jgi:hypothetical protein
MSRFPQHLQDAIDSGRTFLVISEEESWMACEGDSFHPTTNPDGVNPYVAIELPRAMQKLQALANNRELFTKREVATAAGVTQATVDTWMIRGIVEPAKGYGARYSLLDLFCASLAGALRRGGVPIETVGRTIDYIRGDVLATTPLSEGATACRS